MSDATGFQLPNDSANLFNAHSFLIDRMIGKVWVSTLVKVVAVTNSGGVSAVGFVDVVPMVNQLNGAGQAVPHATIYHFPYVRVQGGSNAIILDPQVGDIGIALFAHHDISSVKVNKASSNPGSRRRNDPSDGMYIGGVLNGVPVQYIAFNGSSISVVSPTKVVIQSPEIDLNGVVKIVGGSLMHNGKEVGSTHKHTQVQTGGGLSGIPQ